MFRCCVLVTLSSGRGAWALHYFAVSYQQRDARRSFVAGSRKTGDRGVCCGRHVGDRSLGWQDTSCLFSVE